MAGRTSIYGPKDGGDRVQGVMTRTGSRLFEHARQRLNMLAKKHAGRDYGVSDGETIEFLARCLAEGEQAAIAAIKRE